MKRDRLWVIAVMGFIAILRRVPCTKCVSGKTRRGSRNRARSG